MLQRLSRRELFLVAALVIVGAFFLFYRYVLADQLNNYYRYKQELEEARVQLKQVEFLAASAREQLAELNKARQKLASFLPRFEKNVQDGAPLVKMGLAAQQYKMLFTRFQPLGIVESKYILQLPVLIGLRGNYVNFLAYLVELEADMIPNYLEIRELTVETIQKRENEPQSVRDGTIEAHLKVVFYSVPTPEGRMALKEIASWRVGRANAFQKAEMLSPFSGVAPLGVAELAEDSSGPDS